MENEIWLPVTNYESIYEVSDLGNIRSIDKYVRNYKSRNGKALIKGKLLHPGRWEGYVRVVLSSIDGIRETLKVHRVVANAFVKNPLNLPQVNHKNGIKDDNRAVNLEWCTSRENVIHSYRTRLACNKGERHSQNKLTEKEVIEIRHKYIPRKYSTRSLAKEFGVCQWTIMRIINKSLWPHI